MFSAASSACSAARRPEQSLNLVAAFPGCGIYGVIAYSVSQRTREIGIRLALGARRRGIVSMVVGQGMLLALAGIVVGIGAALALTRLMASLLYDVKPNDPWTFTAAAALLSGTALFASWLPALRAPTIDPLRALRYE